MATTLVTYEEARAQVGTLPTCHPRPNSTNIRQLVKVLSERVAGIPSTQSPENGYYGMVVTREEYALVSNDQWQDFPDPGPVRGAIDGNATSTEQRDAEAVYQAAKTIFTNQQNVKRAVITALTNAVPQAYRRSATSIGVRTYRATDDPRQIIQRLRDSYGRPTPSEKETNFNKWRAPWNQQDPIEVLMDRLEECFIYATTYKPAYTPEQLIDRTLTTIKQTGLYKTACMEWESLPEDQQTWPTLKAHFVEAYEARLHSGLETGAQHGYHGAAATTEDDESSLNSIANNIANIQMANSVQTNVMQDTITTLSEEMRDLRQRLENVQQQYAAMMTWQERQVPPPPPPHAAFATRAPQTPVPQYTIQTQHPVPQYIQAPPQRPGYAPQRVPQTRYQAGRGRGRPRMGRGRGRNRIAYAPRPPTVGQQPNNIQYRGAPNPTKRFNNWNYCFSCGFDVPAWHNSGTCPPGCRKVGHQDNCTRDNVQAYIDAGHNASIKARHKIYLPSSQTERYE